MSIIAKALEKMGLPDIPETRLSLKLTWVYMEAIKCHDSDWMFAFADAMEQFQELETLERLEKLYQWVKVHPPGRTQD